MSFTRNYTFTNVLPVNSTTATISSATPSSSTPPPVIFLDIDGVLSCYRCQVMDFAEEDSTLIHPPIDCKNVLVPLERPLIANLKYLLDKTGGNIVITSTWREWDDSMKFLFESFEKEGISSEKIIGLTPVLPGCTRGEEINNWIVNNFPRSSVENSTPLFIAFDDGHLESLILELPLGINHLKLLLFIT